MHALSEICCYRVISKKIKDASGAVDSGNENDEGTKNSPTKTKKRAGKRKATSSESLSSEGEEKPKRAKKAAKVVKSDIKAEDGANEEGEPNLDDIFD